MGTDDGSGSQWKRSSIQMMDSLSMKHFWRIFDDFTYFEYSSTFKWGILWLWNIFDGFLTILLIMNILLHSNKGGISWNIFDGFLTILHFLNILLHSNKGGISWNIFDGFLKILHILNILLHISALGASGATPSENRMKYGERPHLVHITTTTTTTYGMGPPKN